MSSNFFREQNFQDQLLAFLCRDKNFLKECASLLEVDDFKGGRNKGQERWIIADAALRYWKKYEQPIGRMLRADLMAHCRNTRLGADQTKKLLDYGRKIRKTKLVAVDAVQERVIEYKKEIVKQNCIEELINLNTAGQLTDEKWTEIYKKVTDDFNTQRLPDSIEYYDEIDSRIDRRSAASSVAYPLLFIDPLDATVRAISYGHLGLLLAPWKRGKSLGLIWIAMAYTLQKLNVLYITLEDPGHDVQDRFDAAITELPLKKLKDLPNKVRRKFINYRRLVAGRLRIVDGSTHKLSMASIEEIFQRERNRGFTADAILIDYDDYIIPPIKRPDRKSESTDVYKELSRFIRKYGLIGWTAAQTQRNTRKLKVVTGDHAADDISKLKYVTMAISVGLGDWGDKSAFIYIAAHRADKGEIGWNIMRDPDRMLFYDREETEIMEVKSAEESRDEELKIE